MFALVFSWRLGTKFVFLVEHTVLGILGVFFHVSRSLKINRHPRAESSSVENFRNHPVRFGAVYSSQESYGVERYGAVDNSHFKIVRISKSYAAVRLSVQHLHAYGAVEFAP